ncbi:MAG: hypothetical protein WBM48_14500 [Polyangiales bacterium]
MAYRWLGAWLLIAACSVGCGNDGSGGPPFNGSGGTGGVGGVGGQSGAGGTAGTSGTGGSSPTCTTSALCRSCPADGSCDSADDCSLGFVCIESGCDDLQGTPIKQCVFAGGGACTSNANCVGARECLEVPGEGKRCVKTTPGCDSIYDCVSGFTCENSNCVDRRVPCDLDADCPMNHVCAGTAAASFCERIHRDCDFDFDCGDLATHCEDIDGDGSKECAGTFNPNDPGSDACTNAQCSDPAPVCEASSAGSMTQCGQYGLCDLETDCAAGFTCVALWPDGRKECVEDGGDCSSFADCPVQQVCASPRQGGAPSCQAGLQL